MTIKLIIFTKTSRKINFLKRKYLQLNSQIKNHNSFKMKNIKIKRLQKQSKVVLEQLQNFHNQNKVSNKTFVHQSRKK